jgi:hypothetical protein
MQDLGVAPVLLLTPQEHFIAEGRGIRLGSIDVLLGHAIFSGLFNAEIAERQNLAEKSSLTTILSAVGTARTRGMKSERFTLHGGGRRPPFPTAVTIDVVLCASAFSAFRGLEGRTNLNVARRAT